MMHKLGLGFLVCALGAGVSFLSGCGKSYDPVALSRCGEVVSHARKLLGTRADSYSESMKQCKGASDGERGCAMVADSAADLMRCKMS